MNNDTQKSFIKICLKAWNALKQPIIATVFGLLIGAVLILTTGENPINIYNQMFRKSFLEPYYLMQTLTRATPVIICAIATAAAWRAGNINIGVEGQMIIGSFTATACALYLSGPPIFVLTVSILLGMIAGALYSTIAAALNLRFGTSIVICTLMMNYIANYIASYFVNFPLKDPHGDPIAAQTAVIDKSLHFLKLSSRSTLNIGFLIAVGITLLFIFISQRTVFGYESKMTGLNPIFAHYGGVNQRQVTLKTMALSGAIAAVAGICEIFGVKYRYIDSMFVSGGYAWTGLMAALIANLDPVGMFFASTFLAGLQVGGQSIQRTSNIPYQMATVIQSCITLFVSVKLTFDFIKWKRHAKTGADKEAD